jgi:hypothetical protein
MRGSVVLWTGLVLCWSPAVFGQEGASVAALVEDLGADGHAKQLLTEHWEDRADEIVAACADLVPTLRGDLEVTAPGEELVVGDDGGFVVWSPDPAEVRQAGYQLGFRHSKTLTDDELGLIVRRSSHSWTAVVLWAASASLLARCDGTATVAELGGSGRDVVQTLLALTVAGAVTWEPERRDEPAGSPTLDALEQVVEAQAHGGLPGVRWVLSCFWGE